MIYEIKARGDGCDLCQHAWPGARSHVHVGSRQFSFSNIYSTAFSRLLVESPNVN
jgi:hypothetical protein